MMNPLVVSQYLIALVLAIAAEVGGLIALSILDTKASSPGGTRACLGRGRWRKEGSASATYLCTHLSSRDI